MGQSVVHATVTIFIATRNAHKVEEIRQILGSTHRYLTLRDLPNAPEMIEDADTFEGNARKKAIELARWLTSRQETEARDMHVLADDSGLEVDALNGAPGVHSARFAADDKTKGNSPDAANNAKLLRLLQNVPGEKRTARFRCVIAFVAASHPNDALVFDGACEGRIDFSPRGDHGFGYDPLFVPNGHNQSFAELGEVEKNKLSHRAKALAKLQSMLARQK
jgi:non-canonical purine NTP pyrophosphatase (RdgB/HAM1 family)